MDNIQHYVKHFNNLVEQQSTQKTRPDGYGSIAVITESSFWTRDDYDDGSFTIRQMNPGVLDKIIRFGPLQTTISELFAMGFILQIEGWVSKRNQTLRLIRGHEQYKVARIPTHSLSSCQDLTQFIRDRAAPHIEPIKEKVETPHIQEVIREVFIEQDPLEQLLLRYPIRRKPIEFVGNQTLPEYVKSQLKEQRRLQHVVRESE